MAENKKISELTRVSSLTGAEIVPFAKDGSNGAVTTAKLKEYAQPDLSAITTALGGKVDKVTGKGLSTNDYTNEEKAAVATIDNKVDKVSGKGLSANDYTDADKAKLTALPTNTQLTEKIDEAKLALFIDQWNAACGSYGKYDPANAPDAQHPFYLNTLWLTYAEAIKIAEQKPSWGTRQTDFLWRNIKTNIPQLIGAVASAYDNCFSNIEVVNLKYLSPTSMGTCFTGKDNKSVLNFNAYMLESASGCFIAPNLEVLEISNLKISLDLSKCPLINLASWQGLVTNAVNTSTITVTVHPEVYAKLTATEHSAQARSNLVLKSDVPITSANYPMAVYALNEVPEPGEVLTVTVWGTPSEGSNMYMTCYCGDVGTEGVMTEISTGVWQRTIGVKGKSGPTGRLYIFSVPNKHQSGHIDKVKICYGLDPNPQWSAPVEMPTDPEAIEAIGWERVMLMAAAKQINFATT